VVRESDLLETRKTLLPCVVEIGWRVEDCCLQGTPSVVSASEGFNDVVQLVIGASLSVA
jgi:hypothetical protein